MGEESTGFREPAVRIPLNPVAHGLHYFVLFVHPDGVTFEQSDQSITGELHELLTMNDFQKVLVDEVSGGGLQFSTHVHVGQAMDTWKRTKGK